MSIKTVNSTTIRVIRMIESGDYDPSVINHMLESLVKTRDRRIKELVTKAKPRTFDLNLKSISGALRETIKSHGNITKENIGSAAKRIYGNCQNVIVENPMITKAEKPIITIMRDKTTTHKLTLASDGKVRIKIAIGTQEDEANKIIDAFTKIAHKASTMDTGTLRGRLKPTDRYNAITLYTDSKKEQHTFHFAK